MEEDEIHAQACKFPRLGNGRNESNKIGPRGGGGGGSSVLQYPDEEQDVVEQRKRGGGGGGGGGGRRGNNVNDGSTANRFNNWNHHSSRIIRVSRASGGKDRHSKVMTSKGSRDRRVRLSVSTAIQFYDLQDRLGFDQPSKAVEWLITNAADAIAELPSLPETPEQQSHEIRGQQGFDDSADAEVEGTNETNFHHQNQNQSQNLSMSKSGCSSTSETSKGSGLSLSRSDIRVNRVKARERARERASKEKEKEKENESNIGHQQQQHHNVNPISHTASFTELLTGQNNQQWCSSSAAAPMDYFTSGLLGPSSSSRTHHHNQASSGFSISQMQLGHNSHSLAEAMSVSLPFSGENHSSAPDQMQHQFSFIPGHHHLMPESAVVTSSSTSASAAPPSGNHYDLNFTISSGLAGFNRGTLQSNSPSTLLPHYLQRFSPLDGSTVPFFLGASAAPAPAAMENNNHHHHHHNLQFSPVFDGSSLQLCYGEHSDQKGKLKTEFQ